MPRLLAEWVVLETTFASLLQQGKAKMKEAGTIARQTVHLQ
jgi:hypothetical protein